MTVATQEGASPWAEFGNAGLEDVNARDLQLPRLKINGPECVFENSVSNEKFPELTMIFLGLIKQRAFFGDINKTPEGSPPICKSNDFEAGFPSEPWNNKSPIFFPWTQSGFDAATHSQMDPDLGRVRLSCDDCQLKEWRNGERPMCSELHTYPVLYSHPESHELIPAILTVKSSAIKNSRNLISAFSTANRPMFTAWTRVTLTGGKRGNVIYAVPEFSPLFDPAQVTPQDMWRTWYEQWNQIRGAQRTPPRPFEDEDGNPLQAPEPAVQGTVIQGEASPWQDFQDAAPNQNGTVEWPPAAPAAQAPAPPVAAPPVTTPPPAAQPPAAPPSPSHGRVSPPTAMSEPVAPVQAPPVTPTAPPAPPVAPVAPPVAPPAAAPAPPQPQAATIAPPAQVAAEAPDDLPF